MTRFEGDWTKGADALGKTLHYFLVETGKILVRGMKARMPVDTGFARNHITFRLEPGGVSVKAGIIEPLDTPAGGYPVYIDRGIRRHFLPVIAPSGEVRHQWADWLRRHGKEDALPRIIQRGPRRGMLTSGGLMVWGYRVPWATETAETARAEIEGLFASLTGKLGEGS